MRPRIKDEFDLLKHYFHDAEHCGTTDIDWFLLPNYKLLPGVSVAGRDVLSAPIAFPTAAGYPAAAPYGFYTPASILLKGAVPSNTSVVKQVPPFPGDWLHFSWTVEQWFPADEIGKGSNLAAWARSFRKRLEEGA